MTGWPVTVRHGLLVAAWATLSAVVVLAVVDGPAWRDVAHAAACGLVAGVGSWLVAELFEARELRRELDSGTTDPYRERFARFRRDTATTYED